MGDAAEESSKNPAAPFGSPPVSPLAEGLSWSGIWFSSHLAKMLLPALLPVVTGEFAVGHDRAAIPLTGFLVFAIGSKLVGGWLADCLPCKPLVVGATLGSAASLALSAQAGTFTGLTVFWCLLGLCDGVQFSAGLALMGRRAPHGTYGRVHGSRLAANALGLASAPLMVSLWDGGWRVMFLLAAGIALVALIGFLSGVRGASRAQVPLPAERAPLKTASLLGGASGILAGLIGLQCLLAMASQSITSFTQQFFVTERHLDLQRSAALLTLLMAGGVIGPPLWGHFSDRFGRRSTLITVLLVHSASILAISISVSWWLLASALAILGLVRSAVWPVTYAIISERFRAQQGRIFGVSAALAHLTGSLGLLAVGFLAERHGFATVFPALAAFPLLGAVLVLVVGSGGRSSCA